jgi:DnaJ-class molecular chaperone
MNYGKARRNAQAIGNMMQFETDCGICGSSGEVELEDGKTLVECTFCNGTGFKLTELGENIVLFLSKLGYLPPRRNGEAEHPLEEK